MAARFIDVWVNCPDRTVAETIAADCVERRLAACANILAPIASAYRWKGAIERAEEVPLVLKTRAELFDEIALAVKKLHPYDVPSIVATDLPLVEGDYADWLAAETRAPCG
jgi:periplasmic divalent cation tolerance protein